MLPVTVRLAAGVLACHGFSTDDSTYLLETVEVTGARAATPDEVLERLDDCVAERLILCGHSHIPRELRLPTEALVVNPGSVGWPAVSDDDPHPHVMEAGTPHARYAVLDHAAGRWDVTFRALEYDWVHAARIAQTNGRPDVACALLTGRV